MKICTSENTECIKEELSLIQNKSVIIGILIFLSRMGAYMVLMGTIFILTGIAMGGLGFLQPKSIEGIFLGLSGLGIITVGLFSSASGMAAMEFIEPINSYTVGNMV